MDGVAKKVVITQKCANWYAAVYYAVSCEELEDTGVVAGADPTDKRDPIYLHDTSLLDKEIRRKQHKLACQKLWSKRYRKTLKSI